jgi:hypothetical protein
MTPMQDIASNLHVVDVYVFDLSLLLLRVPARVANRSCTTVFFTCALKTTKCRTCSQQTQARCAQTQRIFLLDTKSGS